MFSFPDLLKFYRDHLATDVMPFWIPCIDWEHGGINNCVADDGAVLSTDKFIWSQGRALWTFSALYNHDGNPEWLRIADSLATYLLRVQPPKGELWPFCLHQDGSVAEPAMSIYVDGFTIYGLTEYVRATGNQEALELAVQIYEQTSPLLNDHSKLQTQPHPIPDGLQAHGPNMSYALFYHELGLTAKDERIIGRAHELAEIVMTQHVKPADQLLYEMVRSGGELIDSDAGNTFLPGHAIESMWFMFHIYGHHRDQARIDLALEVMRWHLEKGWDEKYGGLYLACHVKGGAAVWHQPEAKVWWASTEALYGLLKAFQISGQDWCMDWYWRIHEYTFRKFPNRAHGEWHHYLDRQGNVQPNILEKLAVKDPFHLPRALIFSIKVLEDLCGVEE